MDTQENADFWNERWDAGEAFWDHGTHAPPFESFLNSQQNLTGKMLIPGCGSGHDVHYFANSGLLVTGMDISTTALSIAKDTNHHANAEYVLGDFLSLGKTYLGKFEWVAEHTCLCAIDPKLRELYRNAVYNALKANGHFLAIFYVDPETDEGPPFKISTAEIDELFSPHFTLEHSEIPSVGYSSRKGRELLRLYRKR